MEWSKVYRGSKDRPTLSNNGGHSALNVWSGRGMRQIARNCKLQYVTYTQSILFVRLKYLITTGLTGFQYIPCLELVNKDPVRGVKNTERESKQSNESIFIYEK
jgi:hypothetical protein